MKEPVFFEKAAEFRKWLDKNHKKETELLVGFHKVGSGNPSMTWPESVDQAICYGWIDGVRKSLGADSYTIRFSPRKPSSIWSNINIQKVEALTQQGLMKPAGIASFEKRAEHRSRVYSFEQENVVLDADFEKTFKANKKAWAFFEKQPGSYKKAAIWKIVSAKQEQTKLKRLQELIDDSEAGLHIKSLRWNKISKR